MLARYLRLPRHSRLVLAYLAAVAAAGALPIATGDPFTGIPALLLTAPWSMIMVPLVAAIDPELFDNATIGLVVIAGAALINAGLIHVRLLRGASGGANGR